MLVSQTLSRPINNKYLITQKSNKDELIVGFKGETLDERLVEKFDKSLVIFPHQTFHNIQCSVWVSMWYKYSPFHCL